MQTHVILQRREMLFEQLDQWAIARLAPSRTPAIMAPSTRASARVLAYDAAQMSPDQDPGEITAALRAAADGGDGAEAALYRIVYDELRQMAKHRLRRLSPGQTLQATALVHEAWIKIADADRDWDGRGQFFSVVSRAMRNILVDEARRKASAKHGGGMARLSIDSLAGAEEHSTALEFLALNEALDDLDRLDHRMAKVVMLRYFSGLEFAEVATILEVSTRTAERDWRFARSWLQQRMTGGERETPETGSDARRERPAE